jgi:enoyl-CoA hydratase/carnithine racemase
MQDITKGPLLVARQGYTARIILNRPEKKNALNNAMLHQLAISLREAVADEAIRSIVLTGQGSCFSSGRDIKEFGTTVALEDASLDRATEAFLQTLTLLLEAPKPTIAAVKGFALGGGQALTLACDFVVAERGAQFGNVEMAYGFPAAMNIVLLCRHLGRRLGLEIAMTGQLYSAERYWEMGLINRLVDAGSLEPATQDFVELLNAREPWAVRRTKEAFRMAEDTTVQGSLYLGNQLNQLLRLASQSRAVHSQSSAVKEALKATIQQTGQ